MFWPEQNEGRCVERGVSDDPEAQSSGALPTQSKDEPEGEESDELDPLEVGSGKPDSTNGERQRGTDASPYRAEDQSAVEQFLHYGRSDYHREDKYDPPAAVGTLGELPGRALDIVMGEGSREPTTQRPVQHP